MDRARVESPRSWSNLTRGPTMSQDTCVTPDCKGTVYVKSRGLCSRCYWVRPDAPECSVEGCGRREQLRRGVCNRCRLRIKKYGSPHVTSIRAPGQAQAEIRAAALVTTDECVIFDGHQSRPNVYLNGTLMLASRATWIVANGDPGALHVLHTCHRGAEGCISLRHLYLGDHGRNMADMADAGRAADNHGERNPRARLTEEQVREIRRLRSAGATGRGLAAAFGVAPSTIWDIVYGKNWGWLT